MEMRRQHTTQLMTFPLNYHRRIVLADVAWRGVPTFYLLVVAELLLELKCSCELCIDVVWLCKYCGMMAEEVNSFQPYSAHILYIYHQSESTLRIASWTYLFIFISIFSSCRPTLVNQNTRTNAKALEYELKYKSFFALLWTSNI